MKWQTQKPNTKPLGDSILTPGEQVLILRVLEGLGGASRKADGVGATTRPSCRAEVWEKKKE